jgi:hypothetical protein
VYLLRKLFPVLVCFFALLKVNSQKDPNIYDFFGGKLSNSNKTVFYRLVFQINDSKIFGYSYTDEHGPKETKSIIQGDYDSKNKLITFKESQKLTTRQNDFYNEKCYLQGVLKLELNNSISKIEGTFIEKSKTNRICDKGKIRLISPDKYIYPEKEKTVKEKVILPTFNSNKKTTLKTDDELTIFWNSDNLILEVWDDEKEDLDRISINLDDKIILENYTLINNKKNIQIPLKKTINTLKITAKNTGLIGGNTARIDFIDDKIRHKIISQLQLNKSVNINIIKNK